MEPYVFADGAVGPVAKGFACPVNSICVSDQNPFNGTVSFDNFLTSLENVFVIMSANTFSNIMYNTTDTDYLAAALFFIFGIIVMTFWLANLLIAVIASSFRLVREESENRKSDNKDFSWFGASDSEHHSSYLVRTRVGRIYQKTKFIWTAAIMTEISWQCSMTSFSTPDDFHQLYTVQIVTTFILALEIVLRFLLYLPYWRYFFRSKQNIIDLLLAVATMIILLPVIYNHNVLYSWLSVFQIFRFYRVVVGFEFAAAFWRKVLGNYRTISNLLLFLFMVIFLCSLFAAQLFRGVVPFAVDGVTQNVSFYDLANSFVGMYCIMSTENWTTTLYAAVEAASSNVIAVCFGIFLIAWFIFSNFIIMNLFVAVINENLQVPGEVKRKEQIKAFIQQYASMITSRSDFVPGGLKFFRELILGKKPEEPQSGNQIFDMLLERHVVEGFLSDEPAATFEEEGDVVKPVKWMPRFFELIDKIFKRTQSGNPFLDNSAVENSNSHPTNLAKDFLDYHVDREEKQRTYLRENPLYDVPLYFFGPRSRIRQFCQRIVAPSNGVRQSRIVPNSYVWYGYSVFMLLCTVALVTISCINTPLYYRELIAKKGMTANNWITYTDAFFVTIFTVEAVVKIIADGFWFTPNAYFLSSWNKIDLFVLLSLWTNFLVEIFYAGYVSRFIRCFEALRALRLLSISPRAQETFHSVIIAGIGKIMGAALISLFLLFPFSVWGKNLFMGRLGSCTDGNVADFTQCNGEFLNTPFNWDVLSPRAVVNPYFDYDMFGHAIFVQFGIISLEGWVDLLNAVMSITGPDTNPQQFASRYNAIFPVLYNIISTVLILTLFVSVIIRNYSETRGTAFLTDNQLAWYELEKILNVVKPSIKPPYRRPGTIRHFLLHQVLGKRTLLQLIDTGLLVGLGILLIVEFYPAPYVMDNVIQILIVVITMIYEILVIIRLYALGFRLFIKRKWEVYRLVVVTGASTFTLVGMGSMSNIYYNFQKTMLVGMLLLWIPKSTRLDQLFKTASASFSVMGNLMMSWFILFLVFAIAFNQVFGLTRLGVSGSDNINFRTVPKALILLFRMSCGEGWNQLIADYLVVSPSCVDGPGYSDSDCGNKPFAYTLFTLWNVLSMFIFVNMFVSLIYENFSYVFSGSISDIDKEDIRLFKRAWLNFDPNGTGYIPVSSLYEFLRGTDGYFSMKIYEGKYTVPKILEDCKMSQIKGKEDEYYVDLPALNSVLKDLPGDLYKYRRMLYDLFCTQAVMEADPVKGISFNRLLVQFPFYKTMDDNKCLK